MPPKRDGPLRLAEHRCLSSRVMVVFWGVIVFAVRRSVNVPGKDEFHEMEYDKVPDIPKFLQSCFL